MEVHAGIYTYITCCVLDVPMCVCFVTGSTQFECTVIFSF